MKLQPKDFMIGDWVLVDGNPEQLTGVDREYIHLEGNVSTILLEGEVEPIPLTPEILEKNGFEYDEERTEDMRDLNSYSTIFFNFPLGKGFHIEWNTRNNVGVITDHCFIKFKYVHEFQHVLRLCNINKEIII